MKITEKNKIEILIVKDIEGKFNDITSSILSIFKSIEFSFISLLLIIEFFFSSLLLLLYVNNLLSSFSISELSLFIIL